MSPVSPVSHMKEIQMLTIIDPMFVISIGLRLDKKIFKDIIFFKHIFEHIN